MKLVRWDVEGPRDGVNTAVDLRSRSYPEGIAIWCNPLFKSSKTASQCCLNELQKYLISSNLITSVVITEMLTVSVMKKAIFRFFGNILSCDDETHLTDLVKGFCSGQSREPAHHDKSSQRRLRGSEHDECCFTSRVQTRSVSLSAASSPCQWIYWSL